MMKHQKKNKKLNKDHYHKLLKEYDIFIYIGCIMEKIIYRIL